MTTSTPEKTDGLKALNDAIKVIDEKITELGGVFNIQMAVSYFFNIINAKVHYLYEQNKSLTIFILFLAKSCYSN